MVKMFVLFLLLSFFSVVFSAEFTAKEQEPRSVHMFTSGIFVFYATVTHGVPPACSGQNRWAIKSGSTVAKEIISMVIAAKASSRTITVVGTGNCNPDGGSGYGIRYLYLN